MATIVAAAGGGDWNTGASWVGGVAPGTGDDAQVPVTAGNMSIGAGAVCRSADFSTYTGQLSGTGTLTIGDATAGLSSIALKLVSGMTVTGAPSFTFVSTSATVQTVDFAGKTTRAVAFSPASGGSWQYTGGHVNTGFTTTLTRGTLDVNGQTVTWGKFDANNSNTKVLTLGAANITIADASATVFNIGSTGTTITANTATITGTGAIQTFSLGASPSANWNNFVLSGSGQAQINSAFPCVNFTRTGTAAKTDTLAIISSASITCSGTFTVNSQSAINRVLVFCSTVGTNRTITAASVVITNIVDFQDITGAGAATWTVAGTGATALGDCGGNSGITFTTPATQTFTGTTSDSWSTNAWTSRVPLPQDDVVINNAFSASQTVTQDMPRAGKSISFTGATGTPAFNLATTTNIYGSLTLITGMTVTGTVSVIFSGRGSFTITSAGKTISTSVGVTITAFGGTYTLVDALTTLGILTINNGTFVDAGFAVQAATFASSNSNTRALTMSGIWSITKADGTATVVNLATTTGMTLVATGSTISLVTSTFTRTFSGGGLTYAILDYTVAGSTGEMDIIGANTFSAIKFSDASNTRTLKFTSATTTTISTLGGWQVNGTSGKVMTVAPTLAAGGKWGDGVGLTQASSQAYSAVDHADFKPTGAFTISAWFKIANSGSTRLIFWSSTLNTNAAGIYMFMSSANHLSAITGANTGTVQGTNYQQIVGTSTITDTNWHYGVFTYDGANLNLYVDGVSDATAIPWTTGAGYGATNFVRIGCQHPVGSDISFWSGILDEISLFNGKALSQAEITTLASAELKTTSLFSDPTLKAYYRFETNYVTTDSTAGTHTLTAIGVPVPTATDFILTSPSVQGSSNWMNITGSTVDASPIWYAGANSTDNGGNTGWIFTGVPSTTTPGPTYITQGMIQKLSAKVGSSSTPPRLSELRQQVYGGRGGAYDQLQYLRNNNGDAVGVNDKLSGAWTKFGPANGATGTRADQIKHDFAANGTFP